MQSQSPMSPSPMSRPADDFMGVPKQVWVIATILALLMATAYLGYVAWDRAHDLAEARAQLRASIAQLDKIKADAAKLDSDWKEKLAQTDAQIEALKRDKEAITASRKGFEDDMRAALESKDVTISQLQGKLTVSILDRVMFESGEAVLKADGEAVLLKVASVLKQHPTLKVHVIGHTDNVPMRLGARSRFPSNWELSTARALAAVRFLTEKGGVDPRQLGAVGYGEFRPIADNSTAQGRARNRRIAITVVPDEMVGSDAVPTAVSATTRISVIPSVVATNASVGVAAIVRSNLAPSAVTNVVAPSNSAPGNSAPTNSPATNSDVVPPNVPDAEPPPATPSDTETPAATAQ